MKSMDLINEGSDLSGYSKESVAKLGKIAVEAMKKDGRYDKALEKLGITKETMNVGNASDVYTTAISGFIEARLKPKLTAAGVIKVISNFNTKGQNALKVPLRSALITASDLPDSGQLTHDTGSYGSTTITLTYKYASNQLSHELLKFANADLIAEEVGEIGFALANKVDSDIIAALKVATTSAGTYSNYDAIGTATAVSYDYLVDALAAHVALYAEPDVLLVNPSTTATILKLDEFAGGTSITGALVFKGGDANAFPIPRTILGLRLVENLNCDDDDIYLVDSKRCGYLVQAGDVETFDGRVSGYLAFEVIGALNYGVGIVQPKAVYRLEENAYHA